MEMWKSRGIVIGMLVVLAYGAPTPGGAEDRKNLQRLIAEAKTSADHTAAAAFYREESVELQKEADQHAELAKKLASEAGGQAPWASHHYERAEHCRKFADLLSSAAQEAQSLAKIHESLAQSSAGEQQ